MPDVRWHVLLHDLAGKNMGVRKDPLRIITHLLKTESNGVFNVGRLGGTDCNSDREPRKSGIGPQRF